LVVILGPTASGKSKLAVLIAKKFNGEVISADSRQVYRSLNIGTGKITKKEMQGIPHHCIDFVSPKKTYTVAEFKRCAEAAIAGITQGGKIPILCGGTGLYFRALMRGLAPVPPVPEAVRKQVEEQGSINVTNPDMTRFMMNLDESIDLVFHALAEGKDGEIFVKKAPAAAVGDLAQALISIFSYNKGIEEVGTRPGEKKHETLISSEELVRAEDEGDYYKINPEAFKIDYRLYYSQGVKKVSLPDEGYTSANTKRLSVEEIKELLLSLGEIKEELKLWKSA
ncbi:MAG: polysaccharide biosynthesis protein, partial [Candidatus Nealsonbacteria bacterium]|nr:polysaccharide biosynthesis protein [Candidatus Nealsonbacteria bacterium]